MRSFIPHRNVAIVAALGIPALALLSGVEGVHAVEINVVQGLRSAASEGLTDIASVITSLGDPPAMVIALALIALLSYTLRGHVTGAIRIAAGTGLAFILTEGIKWLVERPRPDVVDHLGAAHGHSFPSGHATVAFALWGGLAWRMWANRTAGAEGVERLRVVVAVVSALLAVAITVSRPYLGVHWPLDSMAGALVGIGSAALADVTARRRKEEEV